MKIDVDLLRAIPPAIEEIPGKVVLLNKIRTSSSARDNMPEFLQKLPEQYRAVATDYLLEHVRQLCTKGIVYGHAINTESQTSPVELTGELKGIVISSVAVDWRKGIKKLLAEEDVTPVDVRNVPDHVSDVLEDIRSNVHNATNSLAWIHWKLIDWQASSASVSFAMLLLSIIGLLFTVVSTGLSLFNRLISFL